MADKQGVPSAPVPNSLSEVGITQTDEYAGLKKAGDVAQGILANMSPLEKTALATAPVPIVGDVAGLAADIDMYANRPEERTGLNYLLSAAGLLPFVPSRSQVKAAAEGIEQLAKQAPSGRIATSKRPFVTRGTQFLEEKVQGNLPKEQLIDQIRKAGLPETDTSMLLQAVEKAEKDGKGRINQYSLRDVYQTISPESRTFVKVGDPSPDTAHSGMDNLTGENLGLIELGVEPPASARYISDDATNLINEIGSQFKYPTASEINQLGDQMTALFNSESGRELGEAVGEDVAKMLDIKSALQGTEKTNVKLFDMANHFEYMAGKTDVPSGLWTRYIPVDNPGILQKMLDSRVLIDVGDATDDQINNMLKAMGKNREQVGLFYGVEDNMRTLIPNEDAGKAKYLMPDPPSIEGRKFEDTWLIQANSREFVPDTIKSRQAFEDLSDLVRGNPRDEGVLEALNGRVMFNPNDTKAFEEAAKIAERARGEIQRTRNAYGDELVQTNDKVANTLKKTGLAPDVYNSSQHARLNTLKDKASQMSMARYADVEATDANGNALRGMHIAELQSDYADELRKKGPRGRTVAKDRAEMEELDAEREELSFALEDSRTLEMPDGDPKIRAKYDSVQKKYRRLAERAYEAEAEAFTRQSTGVDPNSPANFYDIPELYPDMGERGNLQQTIDIMGTVTAAIQRGRNAVSFPIPDDVSSTVAKPLYEPSKFNNNLREAAKRLGKDFKVGLVEFKNADGEMVQRPGITWSSEAEPRIGKEGIGGVKMFRGGGIINAKPSVRGKSGIADVIRKYRREGMMD